MKELENAVVELLGAYEDSTHFSSVIHSVGDRCQPGAEVLEVYRTFIVFLFQ